MKSSKSSKRRRFFAAVVRICFSPADRNNVDDYIQRRQTTTISTGSYFEAGRTNRVEADFEGIECGCAGRNISHQSSGSGGSSSTVIAIATLTALVVLLVLVVLCLVQLKKRRTPAQVAGDITQDACIQKECACVMFGAESKARDGSGRLYADMRLRPFPPLLRWYSIYVSAPRLFL